MIFYSFLIKFENLPNSRIFIFNHHLFKKERLVGFGKKETSEEIYQKENKKIS